MKLRFKLLGHSLRVRAMKHRFKLLAALLFIAQTSTETAQELSAQLSQIMMPLVTIIMLIALPLLVFKVLNKSIMDVIKD